MLDLEYGKYYLPNSLSRANGYIYEMPKKYRAMPRILKIIRHHHRNVAYFTIQVNIFFHLISKNSADKRTGNFTLSR